jgi:hypothetical protein
MPALAINLKPAVGQKDVDFLFGLKTCEWQTHAKEFFACDWNTTCGEHQTGNRLIAFHPPTGIGVSVQPMYSNNDDPPFMIIVGHYIPLAESPPITDDAVNRISASVRQQLGAAYNVRCSYSTIEQLGVVEIVLTQATQLQRRNGAML